MDDLFAAIASGDRGAVLARLAAEPGLAAARDPQGMSCVLWAALCGQPDLAALLAETLTETLTEHGGGLDVFEAAALDRAERVRELVSASPELARQAGPDGLSALHVAAYVGAASAVQVLLELGADVRAVSANAVGSTPLHAATAGGHACVARLLLDAGAPVDARQQGGWTPLHLAAHHGDAAALEALLAAGADITASDDAGVTAADLADRAGHEMLGALLRT